MRVWVAGELPDAARDACVRWRDALALAGARAVPDDGLHLTLAFLGERPEDEVTRVAAALRSVRGAAGGLGLGEGLLLPRRRPRVVAVGVRDPDGSLDELHARVGDAVGATERRRYRPHVTVARLGRGAAAPDEPVSAAPEAGIFAVESVALVRTHLGSGPARHETLLRVRLNERR